jgi:hypothetical protein
MPRYFIDVRDPEGTIEDEKGAYYPDVRHALDKATADARDLVEQYPDDGLVWGTTSVDVRDEQGQLVASSTLAELLRFRIVR